MKNKYSFISCIIIGILLIQYRIIYSGMGSDKTLKITTWDALGYYMYLPAVFIYHDVSKLEWLPAIDSTYSLSGGKIYQASRLENGNFVFKYLGGIAILQLPFFIIGHIIAHISDYPPDGFSPPYQYAVSFGILFYFILAIFLLRKILLNYFSDSTSSITLLLLVLATNAIQYAAIDNGQSHAPLFFLYVLIIYFTIRWHHKPSFLDASICGFIIGLATIGRPTEAIMLFIPLMWNTHTKEQATKKWELVKKHKNQIGFVILFGIIGILPQLIYWKITTGSYIYDVGSKWYFLNPFFRVLFGWEKGWFIYTSVTILFIVGMLFMKEYPFKKSVIYFCLLNIYIIISWADWRYGGSYSTRALVQSYPMFALPLASIIHKNNSKKYSYLFYLIGLYLIGVNLFQIKQYNKMILHYYDMNRQYYQRIYLNNDPTPLDLSLLDTDEWISNERNYQKEIIFQRDSLINIKLTADSSQTIAEVNLDKKPGFNSETEFWLKIETTLKLESWVNATLHSNLQYGDSVKHNKIRVLNPLTQANQMNQYAFYVRVPTYFFSSKFNLSIHSDGDFAAKAEHVTITTFKKQYQLN